MASPNTLAIQRRVVEPSEHKKAMSVWPSSAGTLIKRDGRKLARRQKRIAKRARRSAS